jgi:hypothetical protein
LEWRKHLFSCKSPLKWSICMNGKKVMNLTETHFLKTIAQELTCLIGVTRECLTDFRSFHRNRTTPRLSGFLVCHRRTFLNDNVSNLNAYCMFNSSSQSIISARSCFTLYSCLISLWCCFLVKLLLVWCLLYTYLYYTLHPLQILDFLCFA